MKVTCISGGRWEHSNRYFPFITHKTWKGPKINDVVTVEDSVWDAGVKYYVFVEWPNESYDSQYFVPLEENYEAVTYSAIKEKASVN
jgi:hypothetical protein